MSSALKKLVEMLKGDQKKTSGTDYTATVTRVEDGIAYVQLTGAEINDTPVAMSINANVGDEIRVRVADGKAWITGNDTAPPTDDTAAIEVSAAVEKTNAVVRVVKTTLDGVKKIADNTLQYFWFVSEGDDTGAHITEVTQEEFLDDPDNGGGNLLIRSNGVAVREGLIELAAFSADGLDVFTYDSDGDQIEIAHLGYGEGTAQSGTAYAPYYTLGIRASGSTIGNYSLIEGYGCTASGAYSHSEGYDVTASNTSAHAEGASTTASGIYSHAEGAATVASRNSSHAEGSGCTASGIASHAEGSGTTASQYYAHAEGLDTVSSGFASHAGGRGTTASEDYQTAIGMYNVEDTSGTYAFIVGNGSSSDSRSNAFTVGWDGRAHDYYGQLIPSTDSSIIDFKYATNSEGTVYIHCGTLYGAYGISCWASDQKLKKDISDSTVNATELIKQIQHRSFTWKASGAQNQNGYIAQELQKVIPDAINGVLQDDGSETLQINAHIIIPYLTKAIQELTARIEYLERKEG